MILLVPRDLWFKKISWLISQDIYFAKLKILPNFIITEGNYGSLTLSRPGFSESGIAKGGQREDSPSPLQLLNLKANNHEIW